MAAAARIVPTAMTIAVLLAPSPAFAFEHQLQVGASFFYGQFFDPVDDATVGIHGAGLRGHIRWGFTDAIAIEGQVSWAGHSVPLENGPLLRQSIVGAVGIRWAIDVFTLVPSMAVLVGGHFVLQDVIIAPAFVLDLQAALDWNVRENLAIGVGFSYQLDFGPYGVPDRIIVTARVAWQRALERRTRPSPPEAPPRDAGP